MAVIGLGSPMMWRLGFAVAFLVGSWLFGPKQEKNKIMDPGAEEMPRWNTALRGITIPILFGTNRVSSQIVWQHDYTVVRKETGDEQGGKMGGSGGGKGAAQTGSINYEYYWDLIYHLGMVPEKYALIKGWVGAERINNEAMAAIIGGNSGEFVFVDVEDSNRDEDEKTTMSFEDSMFYSGSGPVHGASDLDYDGWTELETDEGIPVRWPHTLYVGFKQLALGSYPSVPQMSFEVGPGDATVVSNPIVDATHATNREWSIAGAAPFITGDNGTKYFMYSCMDTDGGLRLAPINADESIGTFVEYTNAELETLILAYMSSTLTSVAYIQSAVLDPLNYIALFGVASTVDDFWICIAKIDSAGELEIVGGARGRHVNLASQSAEQKLIALANNRTEDDPIMCIYNGISFGDAAPYIYLMPSPNQLLGQELNFGEDYAHLANWRFVLTDAFSPIVTTDFSFGHHESNRDFDSFWWSVPYVSGMSFGTKLYFYVGKADIEEGSNDIAAYYGATYPNGFVGYIDFGTLSFDLGLASPPTWPTTHTIDIDCMKLLGTATNVLPFDDVGIYADGTTTDASAYGDYDPKPFCTKITTGSNAGGYLLIFSKSFPKRLSLPNYMSGTIYESYITARVMSYNPVDGLFSQIKQFSFEPFQYSDIGESSGDQIHPQGLMVSYDFTTKEAYYLYRLDSSATTPIEKVIIGRVGTLDISGGQDVYPPYIVYEILTSEIFGIGLTTSQIDQASYQAAIDYCTLNNFKVACQFRREESVLNIIDDVLSVYGGFLIISNGLIKFKWLEYQDGSAQTVRTIDNHHLLQDKPGEPPVKITKGARQDTFNKVKVNFFDRNLEYAQNQVEEADEVDQDFNGIRPREFPAIFVMSEQMARTMALRALWSNLYSRDTYTFSIGWKDHDLEPGDVITLVDSYHQSLSGGVTCRIVQWSERERGKFDITAKQEFEYIQATSAEALNITSASIINKISAIPSVRDFTAYEVPLEFQTGGAEVWISWASWEFAAGAYLWLSADGVTFGQSQRVEPYQINGILMNGLPNDDNMVENVEVLLAPRSDWLTSNSVHYVQTLPEVLQSGRAIGTSLLWCGSEMLAYQGVTLVGQNRYRFDKLYRGWGGTNVHQHGSGDLLYKQGGGIFRVAINEDKIDTVFMYKVQPFNLSGFAVNISSIDAKSYYVTGEYFKPRPLGEIQFNGERGKVRHYVGSTIDVTIDWERTSPKNGYGSKGYGKGGVGYGHFNQGSLDVDFRVEVVGSGGVVVRSESVNAPPYTYTSSMNFENNGAWRGNCAFKVTPYNENGDAPRTSVISLELW